MKSKFLKRFMPILIISMMVGLFVGCTKKEETPAATSDTTTTTTETPAQPEAPVVEEVPVVMETIEVWTNNASTKTEDEKMIAEFNEGIGKEKGIKIDYKIYGGDYADVMSIALAADQGPHLFKVPQTNLAQYATVGYIMPINDVPGGNEFVESYGDALQANYNIINGKVFTVPHTISAVGVAYNMDLLKKNGYNAPPATWDELKEMAATITKNGNGKEFGFIEGLKSAGYVSVNGLWQFASSVGHNEFNQVTGKYDFTSLKPNIAMLADMYKAGSWFPGVEGLNNDAARAQFAEGNIGFKLSASWDAGVWQDQFPAKMEWGVCRPVQDTSASYKDYSWQTHSLALGSKAKELPEKALEVLKLFVSDEATLKLYEAGKAIPAKAEIIATAQKPVTKNFEAFADLTNAFQYPVTPKGSLKIEGETMENVLLKAILGAVSVDEAVADLDKRYNEALDKAVAEGLDLSLYMNSADTKR